MKLDWAVEIAGTGLSVPQQVVTNDDFAKRLDTSDEWIVQRTGIRERRMLRPDEAMLGMATAAGRAAMADAGVKPEDIDLIICATFTADHLLPSGACELQAALGCRWIPAYDLSAACSGFVWALVTGAQYIVTGMARTVLVVGVECLSRIVDPRDRSTCVLFGDGAGAAVLRASTDPQRRILASRLGADGGRGMLIYIPAGGSKEPITAQALAEGHQYMRMKGREVYKFAVSQMHEIIHDTAADAGIPVEDINLVVPHQSNLRIIESACEKAGVPPERVVVNIDRYGNTSAASVILALHESRQTGRIKSGDHVLLVAFGAGLTWGSVLLRM